MEKLKPCPFCGGKAEIDINDIQEPEMFWRYAVGCSFFGCIAYSHFSTHFHTVEEAITSWNTRAERTCEVAEYPTGESGTACFSCGSCHYGWHISIYDKPFTYCPNCGAKVVG